MLTASTSNLPAIAFEGASAERSAQQAERTRNREAIEREFIVQIATDKACDPEFCLLWSAIVAEGRSAQKIYQTPEYFHFQREAPGASVKMELLSITRRSDNTLVGVVPVRLGAQEIAFQLGKVCLYKQSVATINLLGSIAAVPGGHGMAQYLMQQLLALFPGSRAVFMHAMPRESQEWAALSGASVGGLALGTSLLGPWRDCHTMPLPGTFDEYLQKFSSKKRYNLNRQIRQLAEQAGELELLRIERPEQVPQMMALLHSLLSPAQRAHLLSEASFEALARKGLLLSYVLRSGDDVLAAVMTTRSPDVVHIHNIFVTPQHQSLSVGTSAMHLAIKDLVSFGCYKLLDFGYGTPNNEFRSSHVIESRAQVLLFERARAVRLLFGAHGLFNAAAEHLIGKVKAARKAWHARRAARA